MAFTSSQDSAEILGRLHELGQTVKTGTPPSADVRVDLIAAAKDLILSLSSVEDHVWQRAINGMEIGVIRGLMKLGVVEQLPEEGFISLSELAQKTSASEGLIERLLRYAVGTKFIDQNANGEYSHTRFSRGYLGDPGAWFSAPLADVSLTCHVRYSNYLDAHQGQPIVEPDGTHNTWTWVHDMEGKTLFDVMGSRPELTERFSRAMRMVGQASPTSGGYPFDQLVTEEKDRVALVDVGGGRGQCMAAILSAFPHLDPSKVVLQDRPEVIEIAKASLDLPATTVKMAHDFMTPQPVKSARAYYMRFIIHDYLDDVSIRILKHLRDAMAPDSKVLIGDMIIPERLTEASLPAGLYDMMLMHVGGKERTLSGFDKLLTAAGLKRTNVWMSPGTPQGIIEAVLA